MTIRTDSIIIKCYFFPFATSKTISYDQIKRVEMKDFVGKGKIWGMNVHEWGYWMAGDVKRWDYKRFIAVYTGSSVTPSFTCTYMEQAYRILI